MTLMGFEGSSEALPRDLKTTNKTRYTVTNYLPIEQQQPNKNNKQPTESTFNILGILFFFVGFLGGFPFGTF